MLGLLRTRSLLSYPEGREVFVRFADFRIPPGSLAFIRVIREIAGVSPPLSEQPSSFAKAPEDAVGGHGWLVV